MFAQAGLLDSNDSITLTIWIIVSMAYVIAIAFLLMSLCCDAIIPRHMTGICLFNMAICGLLLIFVLVADVMKSAQHAETLATDAVQSQGTRGDMKTIAALGLCTKILTLRESTYHVFADLLVLLTISCTQGRASSGWSGCGLLMRYIFISGIIWALEITRNYFMIANIGDIIIHPQDSGSWCLWKVNTSREGLLYWIPWDTLGLLLLCTICACHGACHSPQGLLVTYKHCASLKANMLWMVLRSPILITSYMTAADNYKTPPTVFVKICTVSFLLSFPTAIFTLVWSIPSLWNSMCCFRMRRKLQYEDDSEYEEEEEEMKVFKTERGSDGTLPDKWPEMISRRSSRGTDGTDTFNRIGGPASLDAYSIERGAEGISGSLQGHDEICENEGGLYSEPDLGSEWIEVLEEPPKVYPLPPVRHY